MAELQPAEGPMNGGAAVGATVGVSSENMGPFLGSKRQRRPSVRLGDIGDQPATLSYDSYVRRTKQWRLPGENNEFKYRNPSLKDASTAAKTSKTRPLTNLVNGGDCHETLDGEDKNLSGDGNLDLLAIGNRKGKDLKARRGGGGTGGGGTKRVRSNWVSKVDDGTEGEDKFSGGDDGGEGYRDFDPEGSESPLKEQSPIQSLENMAVDLRQTSDRGHGNEREVQFPGPRRLHRARVSESRDHDAVELDGPSDTDARDWKCGTSADGNGIGERERERERERFRSRSLEDGVRMWLNGLGLGRYAPVFEIHEVDDEVLPLLTLEDLKDMGINAVGSRRKMYCAIQKLGKGFS
ncbi:ankyrin repeat and SAM domain-containing protein 6-like [Macadamia integrifolia]|uniref:ankyrin repeat and SAM domain-containing protein 6-like n=1 Tax=Macadamia integrifolia TaxID=60698 RepID=UPI001C4F04C9|nr:ankyrin repeat and SAM domain-containing protein 6-like [Macadamia integrifolia]